MLSSSFKSQALKLSVTFNFSYHCEVCNDSHFSTFYCVLTRAIFRSWPVVLQPCWSSKSFFEKKIQIPAPLIPPSSHIDFDSEGLGVALGSICCQPPDDSDGLGTTDLDQYLPHSLLLTGCSFLAPSHLPSRLCILPDLEPPRFELWH